MIFSLVLLFAASNAQACAYNPDTGSLSYSSQPTPAYEAKKLRWFTNNETFEYAGGTYGKFGPPKKLEPFEIEALHDKDGIPIFMDQDNYVDEPVAVYIMASSAECSFQLYARL